MGIALRIALTGWVLVALAGCQYADLDDPPVDAQVDAAPAYQVYLRPRYLRTDPTTLAEQQIVIRDRLTGVERVVDAVQRVELDASVNTRMLTFGNFSSAIASGVSSGPSGQSRVTEAQNRRLLYLKGGTALSGGQLWELQLDRQDAPTRRLSSDDNICTVFPPVYDFSNIEETALTYALPGPAGGDCKDSNARPQRQVRLSFEANQRPIFLGSSFSRLGRPLNPDGTVIRQLVDIEFTDNTQQSSFTTCPFSNFSDVSDCLTIKPFDTLNGCRRRDGCAECPIADPLADPPRVARPVRRCDRTGNRNNPDITTIMGVATRDDDLSVRTRQGPPYRLANQFFRVGRVDDNNIPTDGDLVLYIDDGAPLPTPRFDFIYSFKTQFRRTAFINCEGHGFPGDSCADLPQGMTGTRISTSPTLADTMVVVEEAGPEPARSDLAFFADGNELHRVRLIRSDADDVPDEIVEEKIYPPEGESGPKGEIVEVRRLGNEVIFRLCGPVMGQSCVPNDAICELRNKSCPLDQEAHQRVQTWFAIPLNGDRAVELDSISGGTLQSNVLTSTAQTYTAVKSRGENGMALASQDFLREARLLSVDLNGRVVARSLLPRLPGQEGAPFDGSGWLSDVQLDDEDTSAGSSIVRSKFRGDDEIDIAAKQSYVLAFRNRNRGNGNNNTELFALDLAVLDAGGAVPIGTVPGRRDLRDHPDCSGLSLPSSRILPGATGGLIFGYGRRALIQLNTPRSAESEFNAEISDTDIYAADLAVAGSLMPVSTTPPPPSFGKRVFCPDMNPATPIPEKMNAANDQLINR